MKSTLRNNNVRSKCQNILLVLVMFVGVSQQFLPSSSDLLKQGLSHAAGGALPLDKESLVAGLDQYKDQIAEKASNVTGMDKEQIHAGIDWVKENKDRFMEDGAEVVPNPVDAAHKAAEGGKAPMSHPIQAGPVAGGHDLKAPAVSAPKEQSNQAHETVEALKEHQTPHAAAPQPSVPEAHSPSHAPKPEEHKEPAAEHKEAPVAPEPEAEEPKAEGESQGGYDLDHYKDLAGQYKDKAAAYLDKSHQKLKDLHKQVAAKIPKEVMGHEVKPWMKWAVVGSAALCAMVCISYPAVLCYSILQKRKEKYGELE